MYCSPLISAAHLPLLMLVAGALSTIWPSRETSYAAAAMQSYWASYTAGFPTGVLPICASEAVEAAGGKHTTVQALVVSI